MIFKFYYWHTPYIVLCLIITVFWLGLCIWLALISRKGRWEMIRKAKDFCERGVCQEGGLGEIEHAAVVGSPVRKRGKCRVCSERKGRLLHSTTICIGFREQNRNLRPLGKICLPGKTNTL